MQKTALMIAHAAFPGHIKNSYPQKRTQCIDRFSDKVKKQSNLED